MFEFKKFSCRDKTTPLNQQKACLLLDIYPEGGLRPDLRAGVADGVAATVDDGTAGVCAAGDADIAEGGGVWSSNALIY